MGFLQPGGRRLRHLASAARACLKSIRHFARYMNEYSSFFASEGNVRAFRLLMRDYCRIQKPEPLPASVHVRSMEGIPQFRRRGTTDWIVLWDTFYGQFHLPPVELSSPACIVDLGANSGYTMAHFARLYPETRVIGVEMDEGNAATARRNIQFFGDRCRILHSAIWSADGRIEYGGEREFGFQAAEYLPGTAARRSVAAISMPTLMERCGTGRIDFLKVDIEGAEAELFRDSTGWLARVGSAKVEIHPPATFALIAAALKAHGFDCRKDEKHWDCVVATRPQQAPGKA